MGEREADVLRDELAPEDNEDTGVREEDFSLESLDMLRVIGTGTFARVCLCQDKGTSSFYALKILTMSQVIKLKQVEHVINERDILREVSHPFIVSLLWSYKDSHCLYMLFPYICGGELFSHLRQSGKFHPSAAQFYAAEIVSALEYLHTLSIIYRDLKPENLLIGKDGHLIITDFGFAKKITDRTWTLCGTPEYLAPEIIQSKGHNSSVDWWALGILIYEMLAGYPPFYADNPLGIYEKILGGKIDWPKSLESVAKDLIRKLLVIDRTKRIGNLKNGADDIKNHKLFKGIDWEDVYNKKLKPPFVPKVSSDGDTSNFQEYSDEELEIDPVTEREARIFQEF